MASETQNSGGETGAQGTGGAGGEGKGGSGAPKMVPESDLIAAKSGLENRLKAAEDRATRAEAAAEEHRQKVLSLEAMKEKHETQLSQLPKFEKELTDAKAALATATTKHQDSQAKTLDLRKKLLVATYQVPLSSLDNKTLEQLDLFEEAVKTVGALNKSAGNYATVGAGAGGGEAPLSPAERALRTLKAADEKRRTGAFNKS